MKRKVLIALIATLLFGVLAYYLSTTLSKTTEPLSLLEEAGSMGESKSPDFWLNSGGVMTLTKTGGESNQGNLKGDTVWRLAYLKANPIDTDQGFHPQNIFRLITKSQWQNFTEEAYFTINKQNLSPSPNRNQSNAILLFSHYQDSANLYYAGIRVDGYSVIKKKSKGEYFVIDERQLFPEKDPYDHDKNPNLIPIGTPIGLRLKTGSNSDGSVTLTLFADLDHSGIWKIIAEGKDSGKEGGPAISKAGFAGIRTDFFDFSFEDFSLKNTQL